MTSLLNLFLFSLFYLTIFCTDYYKILELSQDASETDIKKAFRRLSVKYHPDKNPGDEKAAERYVEVNKAYEVLSNPEQRQIYDLQGEEGLNKQHETDIWGNQQIKRGPNAQATIETTLHDLYNGATKEFTINKNVICTKCRGTGSKDGKLKECKACGGKGVRLQTMNMGIGFNVQMQVQCDKCGGKGKIAIGNCPKCNGNRVIPQSKVLKIEIEKGMANNQKIVFEKESEQSPDYIPGDVIFQLRTAQHVINQSFLQYFQNKPYFNRIGDNLFTEQRISLKESILGFKRQLKHLDNHFVQLESNENEIIQPFSVKIYKEEGMPIHNYPSQKGDLHSKFIVNLPKKLDQKDKELLSKIFALGK